MQKFLLISPLALLAVLWLAGPGLADVTLEPKPVVKTAASPLDVAVSADGRRTFVLLGDGKVAIYSYDGSLVDTVDVDPGVDKISVDGNGGQLILSSGKEGKLYRFSLNYQFQLDYNDSPFLGKADAPEVLAVFSDFQCPYCAALKPTLDAVLKKYPDQVKIVYKAFPIPSHKMSLTAVRAAFAAQKQGKFWEFYDKIYKDYRDLTPEKIDKIAADLKLDMSRYKTDMNSPEVMEHVKRDLEDARNAEVRGTPSLFLNGMRVQNRSVPALEGMIDLQLLKSGKKK